MKLLDKWMADYEEEVYNGLIRTQELMRKWRTALKEQRTLVVNGYRDEENRVEIPEMKNCCGWNISPNWRKEYLTVNALTKQYECVFIVEQIEVEGEMYDNLLYDQTPWEAMRYFSVEEKKNKLNGLHNLLQKNGCSISDMRWLENGRTEEDIRNRAHKDMLKHKEAIEKKVEKICGTEITHIDEFACDIYVKGSNGRVAHIWAIQAGGYNIQCLHIRVLVKEMKK